MTLAMEQKISPLPKPLAYATLRAATLEDAAAIAAIFNEEVNFGVSTYESVPHTTAQRRKWLRHLLDKNFPVLVGELTDPIKNETRIAGFAALTPFHSAAGYRFTATAQIYLHSSARAQGLGKKLVQSLREEAIQRQIHSVIAGVNSRNLACQALLRGVGFKTVGHFKQIGFKNGQWWDDTCFQLVLPQPKSPERSC